MCNLIHTYIREYTATRLNTLSAPAAFPAGVDPNRGSEETVRSPGETVRSPGVL